MVTQSLGFQVAQQQTGAGDGTHSSALAWKIPRQRSLVGGSPWGRGESDTTERLPFHFSLSCTGKGNGSPLQCSCLENSRDGGAWWAAVYGVAQSRTRLKRLSSSSSSSGKQSACPAGNEGLIPGLGRSPGEGNGNPLLYSCWEIPWTEEPGRLQSMGSQMSWT